MAGSPHGAFEEAHERMEALSGATQHKDQLLPITAAILAVLTALAGLFAHHQSITALALKNEATLRQGESSKQFTYYESKRIKFHVYSAFAVSLDDPEKKRRMQRIADRELAAAKPLLDDSKRLDAESKHASAQSEHVLGAYETLELAATIFEISIVFVSISALSQTRWLLYVGGGLAAVGLFFFATGLLQH